MDIKGIATNIVEQGKAALDKNADGKVEAKEVIDALGDRVKETAAAAGEAAASIKDGLDIDGDGAVSFDEVKETGGAVAEKAKGAVGDFINKIKGGDKAEEAIEVEGEVVDAAEDAAEDVVEAEVEE